MRVIVAGSRNLHDMNVVASAIRQSGFTVTEVVSGGAPGVDRLGEAWARLNNIPVRIFPADWVRFGPSAGPRRNVQMAAYADALVAIWDGRSPGTRHMISEAQRRGLAIHLVTVSAESPGGTKKTDTTGIQR